jgi:mannose-6-phosphate isomerase-like protein (cupin superfamily)
MPASDQLTTQIISADALPADELRPGGVGLVFEGYRFGAVGVSFLLIDAPPGSGPALHAHPYEEVFIVQEGQATFTIGDATIEATASQIVIAPANVPHTFVNSGTVPLRQLDIHPRERMTTTWLED